MIKPTKLFKVIPTTKTVSRPNLENKSGKLILIVEYDRFKLKYRVEARLKFDLKQNNTLAYENILTYLIEFPLMALI